MVLERPISAQTRDFLREIATKTNAERKLSRRFPLTRVTANSLPDPKLPDRDVRRAKVRIIPWVRDPSGNPVVPAGKQPSGRGGNESVEALASEIAHGD